LARCARQEVEGRSYAKQDSPLVQVPSQFVKPIEQVMDALTVTGQKRIQGRAREGCEKR